MKKIWKYAILLVVLSALLCMSVFAAEKPDVANINGTIDVNSNNESFAVSYEAGTANAGGQYLIIMLAGADKETMPDPTKNKILYVNQTAADSEGKVVFDNVYPTTVEDSVIWLTGGANAVALASVKAPAEPQPTGVTVSGTVTSYLTGDATVELVKDGTTVASVTATNGEYSFTGVENGEYTVVVTKKSHAKHTEIITVTENMTLNMTVYLIGDVDGNGAVEKKDSTILARYFAGWEGYDTKIVSEEAADVDQNGALAKKDSTILTRYFAGWTGYDSYFN